jgi:DNA-binding LacI/PurR family transcriptional regulator
VPTVTLRDVAARAGVSIKTVSNVVHNVGGKVSPRTADRVRQAIEELGYRPNLSARRLRSGHSRVIALALPDLRNPYFADVAAATITAARDRGYNVFIEQTGGSADAELDAIEGMSDPMIEGVIIAPLLLDQRQLAGRDLPLPLVLLGQREPGFACDQVSVDNMEASRQVTAHLIGRGYRRIAIIGRQDDVPDATAVQRIDGYRRALKEAGVEADASLAPVLRLTPYSRAAGAECMASLLELPQPPDAVYCLADVLAFGALSALHAAGLRVPDDMGLAGFDGLEEARYRVPTLTTVAPDLEQMAQAAVDALIERIQSDENIGPRDITCDFDLILGHSSDMPAR